MSSVTVRFCTRVDALTTLPNGAKKVTTPIVGNEYLVSGNEEKFLDEFGDQIYMLARYVVEEIVLHAGWVDYGPNGSYEKFRTIQVHLFRAISDNTVIAEKDSGELIWKENQSRPNVCTTTVTSTSAVTYASDVTSASDVTNAGGVATATVATVSTVATSGDTASGNAVAKVTSAPRTFTKVISGTEKVEVYRLTSFVPNIDYYAAKYTVKIGYWPNEQYFTTKSLTYVGKWIKTEHYGYGDGGTATEFFTHGTVDYDYEGTQCFCTCGEEMTSID